MLMHSRAWFYLRLFAEGDALPSICAAMPIIIDGLRHMLEVGCGTGDDAEAPAWLVNNGDDVVGVDLSEP